jgi:two-component system, LytTR family, sensor kinase
LRANRPARGWNAGTNSLVTRIAHRSGPTRSASEPDAERWHLGWHEVLAIVGFWTVFAVLNIANRLVGHDGRRPVSAVYEALFWVLNSYLWAALTPLIFWLAWRFGVERSSRVFRVLLFLGAGAVLVTGMTLVRGGVWVRVLSFPPLWSVDLGWSLRGILRSPWFLNDLVTYGGVLAVGFTREYFVRYQARLVEAARLHAQAAQLQAQLADARLEALHMQLNPHFLFNTLHAISSLVERDPRGVRRMIARLSDLLRYTLQGSNRREVPVEEEIEFLQKYLDIMQVRFEGRLEIETSVALEVADALVPSLILQPLVENAVKHGVSNWVETGRIEIYASRKGDRLVLGVRDNGPGLQLHGEPADGGGVGLHNVLARLQQLYGEDQELTLRPAEGGGVVAEIELPLHTRADLRVGDVAPAPAHPAHDL